MSEVLRILYIIACCFVVIFILCTAAYYGGQAPTFSQSHISLLPYIAIVSSIMTIFLCILVAIGAGMWCLYEIIFRGR